MEWAVANVIKIKKELASWYKQHAQIPEDWKDMEKQKGAMCLCYKKDKHLFS